MNYQKYIDNLNMTYEKAYGKCESVCKDINTRFPELKLIRGHYFDTAWGERAHWWLTDSTGKIVDPTAIQFPSKGRGVYESWDESQPEPTGKCSNCGEYIFDGKYLHKECEIEFRASLYS